MKNIGDSPNELLYKRTTALELRKAGLEYYSVGNFKLERRWSYWVAIAEKGQGLDIETATELHNKMYVGDEDYKVYGHCVRVNGHAGCPTPEKWAMGDRTIDCYHIDTQEGLNEFVRVVKSTLYRKLNISAEIDILKEEIKDLKNLISTLSEDLDYLYDKSYIQKKQPATEIKLKTIRKVMYKGVSYDLVKGIEEESSGCEFCCLLSECNTLEDKICLDSNKELELYSHLIPSPIEISNQ